MDQQDGAFRGRGDAAAVDDIAFESVSCRERNNAVQSPDVASPYHASELKLSGYESQAFFGLFAAFARQPARVIYTAGGCL